MKPLMTLTILPSFSNCNRSNLKCMHNDVFGSILVLLLRGESMDLYCALGSDYFVTFETAIVAGCANSFFNCIVMMYF